ncbi:MAG: thermitase [Nocardioidaceae bacterium]|jgi:cell wall-associated protease|nr:thermitase [Nocardioidaceae bacterium]
MRDGRIVASVVLGMAMFASGATSAGATDDPGAGASLQKAAQKILAAATSGGQLKVVTTTRTSGAPQITTELVSSRSRALDLIISGLRKPSTIGVDIAHEVSIDVSNDTYRNKQWALTRLGAESAWKTSTGSGVVVAVIDTGVLAHSELASHLLAGRDFIAPGTSATDENGHGTHVAGIITAISNNKRGIAGLAPKTKILPVRVLDRSGLGDSANVAKGIIWAVDHGAKVINLSLSSTQADNASRAAVAYAVSKNVVVVAAAGNDGCALLFGAPRSYPAAYDGVLGVGAITSAGSAASYSSCGDWVDVAAPGSGILSTMIAKPHADLGCPASYCTLSGTSMASPYAAAAAALEIAKLGSGAKQATVRSLIQSTADDIGSKGYDTSTGSGVINPVRMLAR